MGAHMLKAHRRRTPLQDKGASGGAQPPSIVHSLIARGPIWRLQWHKDHSPFNTPTLYALQWISLPESGSRGIG